MKGANFSLPEIFDLTLDQLNAYSASINKRAIADHLTMMDQVRFAFHAEQKDYVKQTRDLRREIK